MRILMVTTDVPHPNRGGGGIRAFHIMRHLASQGHVLTVLSVTNKRELSNLDSARSFCHAVEYVPEDMVPQFRIPIRTGDKRIDGYLQLLFEPTYRYSHGHRLALRARIRDLLHTNVFDCICVEHEAPAYVLGSVLRRFSTPRAVAFYDVDSMYASRILSLDQADRSTWNRTRRLVTTRKLRWAEKKILRQYDLAACVSEPDAEALHSIGGRSVMVIPNGVDIQHFTPLLAVTPKPESLVYTGHMSYAPNIDAMLYFCKEILPKIWQSRPNVTLRIVGLGPDPAVMALDEGPEGRIHVVGEVPDTRPFQAEACVVIVPLRLGSGTRLKTLEALAMQRPLVSTSLGAEGLDILSGEHCLLADNTESFAQAVLTLLGNPDESQRIAANGRALVMRKYQWETIGALWEQQLVRMVANFKARRHGHQRFTRQL